MTHQVGGSPGAGRPAHRHQRTGRRGGGQTGGSDRARLGTAPLGWLRDRCGRSTNEGSRAAAILGETGWRAETDTEVGKIMNT